MDTDDEVPDPLARSESWRQIVLTLPVSAWVCVGAIVFTLLTISRHEGVEKCAKVKDDSARLACYDHWIAPHHPARGANAPSVSFALPHLSREHAPNFSQPF
jgi:hypothetical protein